MSKLDHVTLGRRSDTRHAVISMDDVLRYAALTGDFEKIHVDQDFAKTTQYGRCVAHGGLLLGMMMNGILDETEVGLNVSYGYDRVRFIRPIFVGDAVTAQCEVVEKREDRNEVVVEEKLFDSGGTLAVIAHHLYKFI